MPVAEHRPVAALVIAALAGFVPPAHAQAPPALGGSITVEPDPELPDATASLRPRLDDELAPPALVPDEGAPEILIRELRFDDTEVPASVARALEPFIGEPISRARLQDLTQAMTEAYRRSGIALFTIMVPPQSFENGVVHIKVAEGYASDIQVAGDIPERERRLVREIAEPLLDQNPLLRGRFERGVLLADDLPSVSVEPALKLGQAPGSVMVVLNAEREGPDFAAGYNTRESQLIEGGQAQGWVTFPGLMLAGDELSLAAAFTPDFEQSRFASLGYAVPLGGTGARVRTSAAFQQSAPDSVDVSGEAQLYSAGISYPLIRTARQNLALKSAFDVFNSDNAAFGSQLSSERTRAARLGLAGSQAWEDALVSGSATFSQGVDALGARPASNGAEPDFWKAQLDLQAMQRFADRFIVRSDTALQFTEATVPTNERFSIGGARFGKGFDNGSLHADRSAATALELAVRPLEEGPFGRSEIYVFGDYIYGETNDADSGAWQDFDLGSAGAGLRLRWQDKISIELEAADAYLVPIEGFESDWVYSVRWKLSSDLLMK